MIARKSFMIIFSNFSLQIIGWIGLVVLAKTWGEASSAALGSIAFAMSFIALFNVFVDLGFGKAHVKRVSEGQDLGTCIGTYAAIKIILTCVLIIIVLTAIYIIKNVLNQDFTDSTTEVLIYIFLLYTVFTNLSAIPKQTFAGTREIAKLNIPDIFGRIVKVPLAIFVALIGANAILVGDKIVTVDPIIYLPGFLQPFQKFVFDHAVGSLAVVYVIDMFVVFLICFWFLRKYPIKRPNFQMFKSYFTFAIPITLMSVIAVVSTNIDKIMIGFYWTNVHVGYYFGVQRVFEMISMIYMALGTVLFPTFSKFHSENDIDKIKTTSDLAIRYLSMVVVPVITVIIVFVYPIIYILLDTAFLPGAPVLLVLTIYAFLHVLMMPYLSILTGINRPGLCAKISFVICATNILMNYLFIPKNGLLSPYGINGPTGAAVATVFSCLLGLIYLFIILKRLIRLTIWQTHTPRHLIAGVLMAICLYFIAYKLPFTPIIYWYHLLTFAFTGLGIYIGILFILKEFNKNDLSFFIDILHPKKLFGYVKTELKDEKNIKKDKDELQK